MVAKAEIYVLKGIANEGTAFAQLNGNDRQAVLILSMFLRLMQLLLASGSVDKVLKTSK